MSKYEPLASFRPDNALKITCPIFGVQTEIRVCFHLRDLLWSGKRQEVRRGCQACLHASKCPIVPILQETFRSGEDPGYFSREPRNGSFHERHLRRIQNVAVLDQTLTEFGVPDAERAAIKAVSVYGADLKGVKLAALEDVALPRRKPAERPIEKSVDTLVDAAKTGDLAAAISTGDAA